MKASGYLLFRVRAWLRLRYRMEAMRRWVRAVRHASTQPTESELRACFEDLRAERIAREPELAAVRAAQSAAWARLACPLVGEYPADGPHRTPERPNPPDPSVDPRSARAWDDWWKNKFGRHWPPFELRHYYEVVGPLLPFLRGRQSPRVLSAACGISLEVRAFAAAGFHCTGLDISPFAVQFARQYAPGDGDPPWPGGFLRPEDVREGGTCEWVVGDVLDASVCAGPYDAIVVRNYLQYCWRAGVLDEALTRLKERLRPDGVLVATSHGDIAAFRPIEDGILQHGFAWQWNVQLAAGQAIPGAPPGHQLAVTCTSTG